MGLPLPALYSDGEQRQSAVRDVGAAGLELARAGPSHRDHRQAVWQTSRQGPHTVRRISIFIDHNFLFYWGEGWREEVSFIAPFNVLS